MAISRREFLKASGGALAGIMTGCATTSETSKKPTSLPKVPTGPADLILKNGNILTVDSNDRIAQAVSVSKGIIQKVGTDQEVSSFNGPATRVIDLKGLTVTPGIIDAQSTHRGVKMMVEPRHFPGPAIGVHCGDKVQRHHLVPCPPWTHNAGSSYRISRFGPFVL